MSDEKTARPNYRQSFIPSQIFDGKVKDSYKWLQKNQPDTNLFIKTI